MGTVFPLFTNQMFRTLGYNWANSLFGFIGLAMAPIPYVGANHLTMLFIDEVLCPLGTVLLRTCYPQKK